jgi:pyruvate kinase
MRRTRIICTLGPSTESLAMIETMIRQGMDVVRLNMSHATHDWVRSVVGNVRMAAEKVGRRCAIFLDTQGPAIRTGDVPVPLDLDPGDVLELTVKGAQSEEEKSVDVNYPRLVDDIKEGDTVLVDNGIIRLRVLEKLHSRLKCEVLTDGELGSRRHINLPGVNISLPSITEKDRKDIALALELDLDFIALSFVRKASDVAELRQIIEEQRRRTKIIAKIEDQSAVRNLNDLIAAADAVMVARGDLGIECPYEELPIIQRRIVKNCIMAGKPVIVATHMLESMIENPMPTRAEVTDVANAVFEQADAVMLSGETTVGKYPVECIAVLDRIAQRTERSGGANYADKAVLSDERQKIVRSAIVMADELQARGILVFTRYGQMAQFVSWLRPKKSEIFAFANDPQVCNQLTLCRGVSAFEIQFSDDPETTIVRAEKLLRDRELVRQGDTVVIISDIRARHRLINAVQMRLIE